MTVLVNGRCLDLVPRQLRAIEQWARDTSSVVEVRLFGDRARGDSKPTSDIDLCITLRMKGRGNTVLGIYTALAEEWRLLLVQLLEVDHVTLVLYPPEEPAVHARVEREAVLIWQRG